MRYRFIGDTVLTVPFLRNLRRAYPDAQIDLMVAPVSGEIIDKCPYVDNFIYFDTTRKHRYENKDEQSKKDFWYYVKILRKEKYDKAYVLKRSLSSAFLAFASGVKERIGFDTECRSILLTRKTPYIEDKHEIDCFLDVLKSDNIDVKDNYLENWVDDSEIQSVKKIMLVNNFDFNTGRKTVIVHATSGNRKKEWPKDRWAKIIEWLINEKNVQVVFNGTKNDSSTYEEIMSHIDRELKFQPINFCGCFNLRQTLAFSKLCDLIVGCDSGNLHIAASVDIPVIGIYGPMNTIKWAPHCSVAKIIKTNLPCQPCSLKKNCKLNYKCIKDITEEALKAAICDVLCAKTQV